MGVNRTRFRFDRLLLAEIFSGPAPCDEQVGSRDRLG